MIRSRRAIFIWGFVTGAAIGAVLAIALLWSQRSPLWVLGAAEQPYRLWMAALKGFEGVVEYVGSDEEFSYFRAGKLFYDRYKARTSKIRLPRTFPLEAGEAYWVTVDMVPQYDAHPESPTQ